MPEKVLSNIYSTPVFHRSMPQKEALNPLLQSIIKNMIDAEQGVYKSNVGGRQSKPDFFDRDYHEIRQLKLWIDDCLNTLYNQSFPDKLFSIEYDLEGWANVNTNGNYNKMHLHGGSHWSGVYYVNTGIREPGVERNGCLTFSDPRPTACVILTPGFNYGDEFVINPAAGLTVMFPSWMWHAVTPFYGTGERISIAFNITITAFSEHIKTP